MAKLNKDYTLVKINNVRERIQSQIDNSLKEFIKHDIEFIDGNNEKQVNSFFIKNKNINEVRPQRAGVVGHWMTSYNIFKYIVENDIDRLLVIEDDAILSPTFVRDLEICINELPDDFDFFTAYQDIPGLYNCVLPKSLIVGRTPVKDQPKPDANYIHPDWDIGSELIVKAYQKRGTVAYIISKNAAQLMIDSIIKNGFGVSRSYGTTIEEPLYLLSIKDKVLGYQMNPYAKMDKLVTIEKTVPGTDTESQIRDTPYLHLNKTWSKNG